MMTTRNEERGVGFKTMKPAEIARREGVSSAVPTDALTWSLRATQDQAQEGVL
jgi:hypothetical protein